MSRHGRQRVFPHGPEHRGSELRARTWGFIPSATTRRTTSLEMGSMCGSREIHAPTTSPYFGSGTETTTASRMWGWAVKRFSICTGKRFCGELSIGIQMTRATWLAHLSATDDDIFNPSNDCVCEGQGKSE